MARCYPGLNHAEMPRPLQAIMCRLTVAESGLEEPRGIHAGFARHHAPATLHRVGLPWLRGIHAGLGGIFLVRGNFVHPTSVAAAFEFGLQPRPNHSIDQIFTNEVG